MKSILYPPPSAIRYSNRRPFEPERGGAVSVPLLVDGPLPPREQTLRSPDVKNGRPPLFLRDIPVTARKPSLDQLDW